MHLPQLLIIMSIGSISLLFSETDINTIIAREDIDEIKEDYLKGLEFNYVEDIRQVVDLALLDAKVDHPIF